MSTGRNRKKSQALLTNEVGKLQPQAIELEEAVLGAMLLEKDALSTIIDVLSPESFYKEQNGLIFKAIYNLFNRSEPVDILTVTQELKRNGELELVGGSFYVSSLTNRIASAANIEYHARIVAQKYLQRELIRISTETIKSAYEDNTDVFDLLDSTTQGIFSILDSNVKKQHAGITTLLSQAITEIESASQQTDGIMGVPSGFTALDRITGGWQKSDLLILAARPGMGKALFINELVITPKGSIKIGDAKVGQEILGSDGKVYQIEGVFPQGKKDVYRVHFDDNTFVDCCEEHIWEVSTRSDRKKSYGKGDMKVSHLTTNDMINNVNCIDGRKNYSIKIVKPLNFYKQRTTVDPYLLGLYIGDGYSNGGNVKFSNTEEDIYSSIQKLLPECDMVTEKTGGKDFRIIRKKRNNETSDLLVFIKELGLFDKISNKKFIPKNYLYNSVEVRVKLLQGLVDTDGFIPTEGKSQIEYSTVSEQLKDDILELVRGLGGKATYQTKQGSYKKNGVRIKAKVYYRMYLSLPPEIMPVSSKKHLAKYGAEKKYHRKFITKIEPMRNREEMICIKVNSPDHLFITTGYNLTHNTAFVVTMAKNAAIEFKKPVAIFSLEMSSLQLVKRLISSETEINQDKILKGDLDTNEFIQLNERIRNLSVSPLYIDDTPALSIFELRAKARRLKEQQKISLIIIDYLQLMSGGPDSRGNREQEISQISRGLKSLAKELEIPIIALSQLSRQVENRAGGNKRPQLSDLRESGAIEQDADMVMFIYRPEYYGIEVDENNQPTKGRAEIIIAKNRHGSIVDVPLKFIGQFAKFTDLDYNENSYNSNTTVTRDNPIANNNDFLSQREQRPSGDNSGDDIIRNNNIDEVF